MPSDSSLNQWWRKVVRLLSRNVCVICGESGGYMECHHLIPKSRSKFLIWNWRNGVLVHGERDFKICHKKAATLEGQEIIREKIGDERWQYLKDNEMVYKKDYFVKHGITNKEFKEIMLTELKGKYEELK
jgi:hypothetical protein